MTSTSIDMMAVEPRASMTKDQTRKGARDRGREEERRARRQEERKKATEASLFHDDDKISTTDLLHKEAKLTKAQKEIRARQKFQWATVMLPRAVPLSSSF